MRWITDHRLLATLGGLAFAGLATWGCASIIQGSSQKVPIASTPSGATVWIDQEERGPTPFVASLSRKHPHVVRVVLDGYQPFEMTFTRKTSGWVWGNILLGGLIGLAVDASTGGMYKLEPKQVDAALQAQVPEQAPAREGVAIMVVLQADPGWVPIGQLSPAR
jgi:hypothetical protein